MYLVLSLFFLYFISFLWTAGLIQINDDDDDDEYHSCREMSIFFYSISKEDFAQTAKVRHRLRGSSSPLWRFEPARVNPFEPP